MTEIDPYVRVLLLIEAGRLALPTGAYRETELVEALADQIELLLSNYNGNDLTNVDLLSRSIVNELVEAKVLREDGDRFAGRYLNYDDERYSNYRNKTLHQDPILLAFQRIGKRFFSDVFEGYRTEMSERAENFPILGSAPGSDRVVSFSDNQITELDVQTSQVIDAVSEQNQIAETPGLRELLLGQLRAGRELIRAGTFRLYIMELTLIESLRFLAVRYEKEVIGSLATILLAALAKHLGVAT